MNKELAVLVKERCAVLAGRKLLARAVPDGKVSVRQVLPFCWARVPKLGESLGAIAWHGQMDLPAHVVPVELDADVFGACPVFCEVLVRADGVDEMLGMLPSDVLHAEVINH